MIRDRIKAIRARAILLVAMCLPTPLALKLERIADRIQRSESR